RHHHVNYFRQRSGDRHQPTSQQSSHRSYGQNNDLHGSDRRGGIPVMDVTKETGVISPTDLPILVLSNPGVPLRATPIQFALLVDVDTNSNNRNSGYGRDQRNKGQQSNLSAISGSQQSRGPSEGYSYPVCTTCGRRYPESVVELLVLASSVVKLAIYRKIARRT
nr:hypothetical protein [Tanacetum cinerariifolium]